jgi:hypothetical protein
VRKWPCWPTFEKCKTYVTHLLGIHVQFPWLRMASREGLCNRGECTSRT